MKTLKELRDLLEKMCDMAESYDLQQQALQTKSYRLSGDIAKMQQKIKEAETQSEEIQ